MCEKKKILVVDDEKLNINVLVDLLKDEYKMIAAKSGEQALKAANSESNKPDLILLDIMMPEMDGYEVCKRLKTDEYTKDIPIIFITAVTDENSIEKAYDIGGTDYVTKPFKPKELISRVKKELKITSLINDITKSKEQLEVLAQENLEYASYMQKSFAPEERSFQKCFDEFYIINNQKDLVSPITYIFKETREEEYMLIVIDSNIEGIKGAFFSMILNNIEKEMYSHFRNQNNIELNSQWVYNYFLDAIDKQLNTFSDVNYKMGVVYFKKASNDLKFTGNSSLFLYEQNGVINKIDSSSEELIDKTIEFDESIRFYFHLGDENKYNALNEDIAKTALIPIVEQKEKLKESLNENIDNDFLACFVIDNKVLDIFDLDGLFDQNTLGDFSELIEDKVENVGVVSNLVTILAEQYQNIMNYSKSEDVNNNDVVSTGYINLQESSSQYTITSKNIISLEDKERIEPRLTEIEGLDRQGIRKRYRELLKSGKNTHEKGGGVGFYLIAKSCNEMEYEFSELNEARFSFTVKSIINKK